MQELLTKKEVMSALRVSRGTLDTMRQSGEIPFVKVRGQVRFRQEDVTAYILANLTTRKAD
ncbi:hypothetical protein AYO47_03925 [Planctomyces sp. SCGC AG-212-M04]|nr:hypothetical protein AYO47_03925 [Planctomyces sp. SCGC AG-212-M04]